MSAALQETLMDFQARAARSLARHDARVLRRVSRASVRLRLARAEVTEARRRMAAAQAVVDAMCDDQRGRTDRTAYLAIITSLRVGRALAGEPEVESPADSLESL